MRKTLYLILITFICSLASCSKTDDVTPPKGETTDPDQPEVVQPVEIDMIRGADISWLSQMEASGIRFFYESGAQGDCMEILRSLGMNTFRIRLWVNPANQYNSTADVIAKAKRARDLGMHIMLSIHYSDSWADPGKQTVPAEWAGLSLDALADKVKDYTRSSMMALKEAGITPEWVQIGNETGNGMLWPYGQADKNPAGYARLNNAGYDALKEVFPDAMAIVHLQEAQNQYLAPWLFDILNNNGGKYDAMGFSLYPDQNNWASMLSQTETNFRNWITRYSKPIILCEVGMGNSYVTECYSFLKGCFELQTKLPAGKFLGVLYWEPQVYNDWQGYKKGAFTSLGRPSEALNAFASSANP